MIENNDIEIINNDLISYIDDNNICYQYETWEQMSKKELEDAKAQFALILSISKRDRASIEKHMQINGYDGIVDVYEVK